MTSVAAAIAPGEAFSTRGCLSACGRCRGLVTPAHIDLPQVGSICKRRIGVAGFTVPEFRLDTNTVDWLKTYDSPTVANAIETFKVRDRTEGYIGGWVRAMFDNGVM